MFIILYNQEHFKFSKMLTILFGVSDANFWVSVENAGVSGKVGVGVSGRPPVMMLSSYTRFFAVIIIIVIVKLLSRKIFPPPTLFKILFSSKSYVAWNWFWVD